MKLNSVHLKQINSFLRLKDFNDIPVEKQNKIEFFEKFIIGHKGLFKKGRQFCSTYIGNEIGVSAQTVRNWLKELEYLRMLKCVSRSWRRGAKSKTYAVDMDNFDFVCLLNEFSGYLEYPDREKILRKKEIRTKAWNNFNPLMYEFSDCIKLAQCYLGCPQTFVRDIKHYVSEDVLNSPRERNLLESRWYDFYWAYQYVCKSNGFWYPKRIDYFLGRKTFWSGEYVLRFTYDDGLEAYGSLMQFKKKLLGYLKLNPSRENKIRYNQLNKSIKFAARFKREYLEDVTQLILTPYRIYAV